MHNSNYDKYINRHKLRGFCNKNTELLTIVKKSSVRIRVFSSLVQLKSEKNELNYQVLIRFALSMNCFEYGKYERERMIR